MPKIVAQKQDWIKLGYQLFSKEGIKGIIIEKMAKKLNCNKSSFYWHFKSKKLFMDAVIQWWITTETEQIITLTNKSNTNSKKLNNFLSIVFKNDPYLEFIFYLKKYALKHKKVQEIIDYIDKHRIDFTTNLFQELGYSKKEALVKASVFYKYLIGYHEIIRHKKQDKNYLIKVKEELNHFLKL